jgi:hypothetical protein
MKSHLDEDVCYSGPKTLHFNVRYKNGAIFSRVTLRHFMDATLEGIDSVWIVQRKRYATKEEIVRMCAGEFEQPVI